MFARTFSIYAKDINMEDPEAVLGFMADSIQKDLAGKPPLDFYLLADVDPELEKIVFYDVRIQEQIMEISNLFGRIPVYSVIGKGDKICLYFLNPENSKAKIIGHKTEDGKIVSVFCSDKTDAQATKDLHRAVSVNFKHIQMAMNLTGTVVPNLAENQKTGEKRAMFTVKIDDKAKVCRPIFQSTQKVLFAWSMEESTMIFLVKMSILPPIAMFFPMIGKGAADAMTHYQKSEKAVGMIMYSDDVTDSFEIHNGIAKFAE